MSFTLGALHERIDDFRNIHKRPPTVHVSVRERRGVIIYIGTFAQEKGFSGEHARSASVDVGRAKGGGGRGSLSFSDVAKEAALYFRSNFTHRPCNAPWQ